MRFGVLAATLLSAAAVRADVADDLEDVAGHASMSASSFVEPVTSSALSKPTFTVRIPSRLSQTPAGSVR